MARMESSDGWKRFLEQFEATGRTKGEGYDRSHFSTLDEEEIIGARRMLLERGLAGDTVDLHGLRFAANATVIAALEHAVAKPTGRDPDYEIACRETLFELTQDPAHVEALLRITDGGDPEAGRRAAEALARLSLPAHCSGSLARRLMDGRHEQVRAPLLQAWLGARETGITASCALQRNLLFARSVLACPSRHRAPLLATWPVANIDGLEQKNAVRRCIRLFSAIGLVFLAGMAAHRYLHTMPIGSGESRKSPDGRFTASITEWSERDFFAGTPRHWFQYRVEGPGVALRFKSESIDGPYFGSRSSHRVVHWHEDSRGVDFAFPCTVIRLRTQEASESSPAGMPPVPSARLPLLGSGSPDAALARDGNCPCCPWQRSSPLAPG